MTTEERIIEVAAWLQQTGHDVLDIAYAMGRYRLHIVARKDGVVSFIEVCGKRRDPAPGKGRRSQIGRLAAIWALRNGRALDHYRFDTASFDRPKGTNPPFTYYPDTWRL